MCIKNLLQRCYHCEAVKKFFSFRKNNAKIVHGRYISYLPSYPDSFHRNSGKQALSSNFRLASSFHVSKIVNGLGFQRFFLAILGIGPGPFFTLNW